MTQPFEVSEGAFDRTIDALVDAVMGTLQSGFLIMPRGSVFVAYPDFEDAYEGLRQATGGFTRFRPEEILARGTERPLALLVLRTILGFTPPEWAHVATTRKGIEVPEGYSRALDKRIRSRPQSPLRISSIARDRLGALVATACELLEEGPPEVGRHSLHRLDKFDTASGSESVRSASVLGVPYAAVLYERMLGRPFATHRDSVSERVGDLMEVPIEDLLSKAGIPYRKTGRAQRIPGFDQAPDFLVPTELNPRVVIEAKITEDAGTARDKITRVQRLCLLARQREAAGEPPFEVIACIDGRGFVRRKDVES